MARGDIGFFMVNWIYGVVGPMALVYLAGLFSQDRADVAADHETWQEYAVEDQAEEDWPEAVEPA